MAPFPLLLANRARLTQASVHEAVHDWLSNRGGFRNVRFVPSRIRREQVRADVDPSVAFGANHVGANSDAGETTAGLEVQFESPRDADRDYYRVQWVDPERNYSVGWHQDGHRENLGACHLQLDYGDEVADVRSTDFLDAHPLNVLEARLERLPDVLDEDAWDGDEPQFEYDSDFG